MTMRVVFLKDHRDFKAMDEAYIPRPLGRNLCQQEITVPWGAKDSNPEYKKLKKQVKSKPEKQVKPKKKPRKKRGSNVKKAISEIAETREKAIAI